MKKKVGIFLLIIIVLITIKYFSSDYKIEYVIDKHKVVVNYSNKRYYIEIDNKYNFDIYKNRKIKKLKIDSIEYLKDDNVECIYPKIKNLDTYPLCYDGNEYINFNLIDNELINKYKKEHVSNLSGDFSYNSNLSKKEYVYLWNYKGFYMMNEDILENINLFEEGRYDNNLMIQIKDKLIFPNYDNEVLFKTIYILNMNNGKTAAIEGKYDISYDSYFVGSIKNKLYLFDHKSESLYEINIKKFTISLVGNDRKGYYKYADNKKVSASVKEYLNKGINYKTKKETVYKYSVEDNKLYKELNDNSKLKELIFIGENIKIVSEYENILYYRSNDIFYKYNPLNGSVEIFSYFEMKFNNNSIIYIYNK